MVSRELNVWLMKTLYILLKSWNKSKNKLDNLYIADKSCPFERFEKTDRAEISHFNMKLKFLHFFMPLKTLKTKNIILYASKFWNCWNSTSIPCNERKRPFFCNIKAVGGLKRVYSSQKITSLLTNWTKPLQMSRRSRNLRMKAYKAVSLKSHLMPVVSFVSLVWDELSIESAIAR